jgi:hypothetical protein
MTMTDLDQQTGLFGPVDAPADEPSARSVEPLTAREKEILLFEQSWWRYPGAKEAEIRKRWDMNTVRFYQVLNQVIEKEAALAWDPVTVRRLRRQRDKRLRTGPPPRQ